MERHCGGLSSTDDDLAPIVARKLFLGLTRLNCSGCVSHKCPVQESARLKARSLEGWRAAVADADTQTGKTIKSKPKIEKYLAKNTRVVFYKYLLVNVLVRSLLPTT